MSWIQDFLPGMEFLAEDDYCPVCLAERCGNADWICPSCGDIRPNPDCADCRE